MTLDEFKAACAALAADAPDYRWDANKGYAAAAHREALRRDLDAALAEQRCGIGNQHRESSL